MSTVKVDTLVASDGTSPVTLTKQEALKFWVTYDATNQTTRGSLNQSSLTDEAVGRFHSSFTNSFSSATDKCAVTDLNNSTNNSTINIGQTRGGIISNVGTSSNGTFRALSASEIQFYSNYGSSGTSDGSARDFIGHYVMVIGDLA
jgi:hypothetical protein